MGPAQAEQLRSSRPEVRGGLDISVRAGSGSGSTMLSAFDHALQQAGVADFNLVTLSSVIPPGSRIRSVNGPLSGGHGDLLFCVRAQAFAEHPGEIAWAGLGWCVDESGGGLFVEHHGGSEVSVVEQIELSLADMNARRGGGYGPVHIALASAHSTGLPVCALVVAAYRVATWDEPDSDAARRARDAGADITYHDPALTNGSIPRAARTGTLVDGSPVEESGQEPSRVAATAAVGTVPDVRVTVEKEVDYATARDFYRLYQDTFGELETQAVARQVLHESEFLEEMHNPRVAKYVAWDDEGRAIGMTTMTSDLSTVPWISPAYFAHHYPEHYARGAIYYLGFTLVHPAHRGAHVFHAMIAAMAPLIPNQPVVAWDMCLMNDERGLGGSAGQLLDTMADVTIVPIDHQNYYAATFHGPRPDPATP